MGSKSRMVVKLGAHFAPVPHWAIDCPEFGRNEVAVLACLLRFRDWDDETAYPSQHLMAEIMHCSSSTINIAIGRLEELGMVVDRASGEVNVYDLEPLYERWRGWKRGDGNRSIIERKRSTIERRRSIIGHEQEPVLEPLNESSTEGAAIAAHPEPSARTIVKEHLCERLGRPRSGHTQWGVYEMITSSALTDFADPIEACIAIDKRLAWMVKNWGREKATPASLENRWPYLGSQVANMPEADIQKFESEQFREALLRRHA